MSRSLGYLAGNLQLNVIDTSRIHQYLQLVTHVLNGPSAPQPPSELLQVAMHQLRYELTSCRKYTLQLVTGRSRPGNLLEVLGIRMDKTLGRKLLK
jgi:hypothetical protein